MPSPFPGMDPYLERHWRDVHGSLITFSKVALQRQLVGGLFARSEERVYIDDDEALHRQDRYPDVRIVEHGIRDIPLRTDTSIALAEPIVISIESDPIVERFIQILDAAAGGRVVTVIEFVSPSNKLVKAARKSYQDKQGECFEARTSLVEVDLTRAGHRELLVHENELPAAKRGEYLVSVYRGYKDRRGRREGYGVKLRERLPGIRIPLRDGDPDIGLDLQSLIDQAYEAGAYARTLDYSKPCDPPLSVADDAWATELLRSAGRRPASAEAPKSEP